jgi:hypothetical protein
MSCLSAGNVASMEGLLSEFCSCYGSQHLTTVIPEFEYKPVGVRSRDPRLPDF